FEVATGRDRDSKHAEIARAQVALIDLHAAPFTELARSFGSTALDRDVRTDEPFTHRHLIRDGHCFDARQRSGSLTQVIDESVGAFCGVALQPEIERGRQYT